ncbi:hypothetical protein RF55_22077 [Lasius niger]|uniref:DUF333 domain-containing protein n=1 Tax=Lasius niger TaxID=67767 RepID=A0A0J7JXX0_LASNI|nr:hypothetical protein RF55_22077 [Lasius niger]
MKKRLATTALLTSTLGVFGFVGASQAFATASQTHTSPAAQDKINAEQAQATAVADKKAGVSDDLKSQEQKDVSDAKANDATVGTLVGEEAKQVGAQDQKKAKATSLIDQKLAQTATATAQKNAQAAADKGQDAAKKAQKTGGKADPAAIYCAELGGHAHMGKGITGKETQYCYLPNNTRVPATKAYQDALKGKGTIAPTKSVTHLKKEQKQDITDENQQLKQDAAEKQRYEKRQASK